MQRDQTAAIDAILGRTLPLMPDAASADLRLAEVLALVGREFSARVLPGVRTIAGDQGQTFPSGETVEHCVATIRSPRGRIFQARIEALPSKGTATMARLTFSELDDRRPDAPRNEVASTVEIDGDIVLASDCEATVADVRGFLDLLDAFRHAGPPARTKPSSHVVAALVEADGGMPGAATRQVVETLVERKAFLVASEIAAAVPALADATRRDGRIAADGASVGPLDARTRGIGFEAVGTGRHDRVLVTLSQAMRTLDPRDEKRLVVGTSTVSFSVGLESGRVRGMDACEACVLLDRTKAIATAALGTILEEAPSPGP